MLVIYVDFVIGIPPWIRNSVDADVQHLNLAWDCTRSSGGSSGPPTFQYMTRSHFWFTSITSRCGESHKTCQRSPHPTEYFLDMKSWRWAKSGFWWSGPQMWILSVLKARYVGKEHVASPGQDLAGVHQHLIIHSFTAKFAVLALGKPSFFPTFSLSPFFEPCFLTQTFQCQPIQLWKESLWSWEFSQLLQNRGWGGTCAITEGRT